VSYLAENGSACKEPSNDNISLATVSLFYNEFIRADGTDIDIPNHCEFYPLACQTFACYPMHPFTGGALIHFFSAFVSPFVPEFRVVLGPTVFKFPFFQWYMAPRYRYVKGPMDEERNMIWGT
jgi:hypothetical protein